MEPRLAHGERVRLVDPAVRRPRFGDIALVERSDGALRLHRLIWPILPSREAQWRSKPDQGRWSDGRVNVLATVALPPSREWLMGARSLLEGIWFRVWEKFTR
jgi:hypothetical protein